MQFELCENCLLQLQAIPASLLEHLHSWNFDIFLITHWIQSLHWAPGMGSYSLIPAELLFSPGAFPLISEGLFAASSSEELQNSPWNSLCPWFQWLWAQSRCPGQLRAPPAFTGLIHKVLLSAKPAFPHLSKVRSKVCTFGCNTGSEYRQVKHF